MSRPVQPVEDFTNTCMIMAFVNLFWFLGLIFVLWGLPAVMIVAVIMNAGINRLESRQKHPA